MKITRTGYLSTVVVPSGGKKVGAHKIIQNRTHFWNARRADFVCICRHKVKIYYKTDTGKKQAMIPLPLWIRPVPKGVA